MSRENYVGRAGQMAVMAEFLLRGFNVAIPEVDEGDDIFVVNRSVEDLWRVQVKTAMGVKRQYGFSGQFRVPLDQLQQESVTPFFYVFTIRCELRWEFLILSRDHLFQEWEEYGVGSPLDNSLVLYITFRNEAVICSGRDWQPYRNDWNMTNFTS